MKFSVTIIFLYLRRILIVTKGMFSMRRICFILRRFFRTIRLFTSRLDCFDRSRLGEKQTLLLRDIVCAEQKIFFLQITSLIIREESPFTSGVSRRIIELQTSSSFTSVRDYWVNVELPTQQQIAHLIKFPELLQFFFFSIFKDFHRNYFRLTYRYDLINIFFFFFFPLSLGL